MTTRKAKSADPVADLSGANPPANVGKPADSSDRAADHAAVPKVAAVTAPKVDRLVPIAGRPVLEVRFLDSVAVGGAGGKQETFVTKLQGAHYKETVLLATESFLWIRHRMKATGKVVTILVPMSNVVWMTLED